MTSTGERGQASIELVGMVPLCVVVLLALAQLLAAGAAREAAGAAAQAGAMAMRQGGGPADAARAAVPGWTRERLRVRVDGRRVTVRIVPPALLPVVARSLAAAVTADAGPAA
jgi:hypothetical protein